MPLTVKRKAELAQMNLPDDEEMIRRIKSFISRAGMSQTEFSEQIGYSMPAVNLYLNGRYGAHHPTAGNTLALRAAAKEYMDLHDVDQVHRMRGTHVETTDFTAIRASAFKALEKGTAYIVDGPPGTQKTWSFRMVEKEINSGKYGRAVYIYARVGHSPLEFLKQLCINAGIPNRGTIDMLLRKLAFFLAHGRTLLIVDEAQHLDLRGLEILRQLLDLPPYFGVMLGGSHDLSQRLQHWQMEQWRRRVQQTLALTGPSVVEARKILAQQLHITDPADADEILRDCRAKASRAELVGGKQVSKAYDYISAGLLFDFIEGVRSSSAIHLEATA